jgi:hypothetical protein
MGYPVNDPAIQASAIAMRAAGATLDAIGDKVGLSHQTISRALSKPGLDKLIDAARNEIINDLLPKSIDNVKFCVNGMQTSTDKQFKYFGYDISKEILKSVGLLASPTTSIQFQQIFNQQQVIINPVIQRLLQDHDAIIDADFSEDLSTDKE